MSKSRMDKSARIKLQKDIWRISPGLKTDIRSSKGVTVHFANGVKRVVGSIQELYRIRKEVYPEIDLGKK